MVTYDEQNRYAHAREVMVRNHLMGRDIKDPRVLEAFREVPREQFLPEKYVEQAYADNPIPIGMGQTISQPYIVALMTQTLEVDKSHEVLELGTGSGYQTAILARLARRVYTIERHRELTESAQAVLGRLGVDNVEFCIGDGSKGWPDPHAFDRIMITAAAPQVPEPIREQLKERGCLVAPVGGVQSQELIRYRKQHGDLKPEMICGCRFVKLIGEHGFGQEQ